MDINSLSVPAGCNVGMDEHHFSPCYIGHRAITLRPYGRFLLRAKAQVERND
jgi:hypothetical protein